MMENQALFTIKSWQEDEVDARDGSVLLKQAKVTREHEGYVQGSETMNYHLIYAHEKRSEFNGIGIFNGTVGELEGVFTFIERGSYQNDGVLVEFEVYQMLDKSNFGPLLGKGSYQTREHGRINYVFDVV